uniref:Uncharacterized protein n=1 Tax=Lactuca sativa TaxID=4236 RepID=A0A9R1UTW7_LACSA|nr:hypothetical protein LSAT_V11C800445010 [Lactuca sativa]
MHMRLIWRRELSHVGYDNSMDMVVSILLYRMASMNGSNMWPETKYTPPLPRVSRRMSGRPTVKRKRDATKNNGKTQTKKSKKSTDNNGAKKVSKSRRMVKCGIFKKPGHNKATCSVGIPHKLNIKKKRKQNFNDNQVTKKQLDHFNYLVVSHLLHTLIV